MPVAPAPLRISALTPNELDELDRFLMSDATSSETLMLDALDGYLTAIVIGPVPLRPVEWLPRIWGSREEHAPRFASTRQALRIKELIIRHLNGITLCFMRNPRQFEPLFNVTTYADSEDEFIDADMWAFGFMKGMSLTMADWKPLLSNPEAENLLRPLYLLGSPNLKPAEQTLRETREQREALAHGLAARLADIYAFWTPYRTLSQPTAEATQAVTAKPGRNELCFCGSGKKFKKCCGAVTLH